MFVRMQTWAAIRVYEPSSTEETLTEHTSWRWAQELSGNNSQLIDVILSPHSGSFMRWILNSATYIHVICITAAWFAFALASTGLTGASFAASACTWDPWITWSKAAHTTDWEATQTNTEYNQYPVKTCWCYLRICKKTIYRYWPIIDRMIIGQSVFGTPLLAWSFLQAMLINSLICVIISHFIFSFVHNFILHLISFMSGNRIISYDYMQGESSKNNDT